MTDQSRSKIAMRPSQFAFRLRVTAATLATACVLGLLMHVEARAADAPAADTSDQAAIIFLRPCMFDTTRSSVSPR